MVVIEVGVAVIVRVVCAALLHLVISHCWLLADKKCIIKKDLCLFVHVNPSKFGCTVTVLRLVADTYELSAFFKITSLLLLIGTFKDMFNLLVIRIGQFD